MLGANVRQVLDYSRRRDPKKTSVQITDVVRSTVDLLKPLIQKRGVHVEIDDNSNNLTASLDAAQVQQALTNLILNAVQASPDGSAVKIEISSIHAGESGTGARSGDQVIVSVSDSGPGMGDEALKRLFEPFFTTKEPGQGTGLGLSLAYDIVKAHGGEINVETTEGEGTEFIIHLPDDARMS